MSSELKVRLTRGKELWLRLDWGLQQIIFKLSKNRPESLSILLDEDMTSDTERLSSAESEKDETEVQLEKLVFGDNCGFHEKLKSYNDDDSAGLRGVGDADGQQSRGGLEVENMEGLDDADVCKDDLPLRTASAQYPSSYSSSTRLHLL